MNVTRLERIVDVQVMLAPAGSALIEDVFLESGDVVFVPERIL